MLRTMVEQLINVPADIWDDYALRNEPLRGKMQNEVGARLIAEAHSIGEELAEQVAAKFGRKPKYITENLDIKVEKLPKQDEGNYNVFALFTEPDSICLYQNTLDAAEKILIEEECSHLLGTNTLSDILIAHELYHWYEYKENLATGKKVLTLWKLGKFAYNSKVLALGEIAAMAFAQSLLGLTWSPFCLDVILLYPTNKSMAIENYDYIVRHADLKGELT